MGTDTEILNKLSPEVVDPMGFRRHGLVGAVIGMLFLVVILMMVGGGYIGLKGIQALNASSASLGKMATSVSRLSTSVVNQSERVEELTSRIIGKPYVKLKPLNEPKDPEE